MSVFISCFEEAAGVPAVTPQAGYRLHRALAPDALFRYITVGEQAPDVPPGAPVRAGEYEVVHTGDKASAPFDPDGNEPTVMFVNCFVIEPGREAEALAVWHAVNAYMVEQPGYLWHKLHKRVNDDAAFAFVNVVEWESAQAWQAAHDDGFRALVRPPLPFVSLPTLCELVGNGDRQSTPALAP